MTSVDRVISTRILPRTEIDSLSWDACVAASPQQILYGYSWYLDAVLPAPSWKWVGLVLIDETNQYQSVMPIPLRQKRIAGVACGWVVHQPFFCQMLGVFTREGTPDVTLDFWEIVQQRFRYVSILATHQQPIISLSSDTIQLASTHSLDLSIKYSNIFQRYSRDRKQNLRRAQAAHWTVANSTDLGPLITLFKENHAAEIEGGVADWAYDILENLVVELKKRDLATLRYAMQGSKIDAGALCVQEGNRVIYLFNAASKTGREGNARTLLIDQIIQENAGRQCAGKPMRFDFESPKKPSIRAFYQSFGASEEPFWEVRWNRLNAVENVIRKVVNRLNRK